MSNTLYTLIFDYWREIRLCRINKEYTNKWIYDEYMNCLITRNGPIVFMNFRQLNAACKSIRFDYTIKNKGHIVTYKLSNVYFCLNVKCICKSLVSLTQYELV